MAYKELPLMTAQNKIVLHDYLTNQSIQQILSLQTYYEPNITYSCFPNVVHDPVTDRKECMCKAISYITDVSLISNNYNKNKTCALGESSKDVTRNFYLQEGLLLASPRNPPWEI